MPRTTTRSARSGAATSIRSAAAFLQVLLLAKELKLLRVGTVERGRPKVDASPSATASATTGRGRCASSCEARSRGCLDQAEHADTDDAPDRRRVRHQDLSRRRQAARRSWTNCCRRSWNGVRRRVRTRSGRAYERKVASSVERRLRDRARVGTSSRRRKRRRRRPDQPDGRGQCADAQEPAPSTARRTTRTRRWNCRRSSWSSSGPGERVRATATSWSGGPCDAIRRVGRVGVLRLIQQPLDAPRNEVVATPPRGRSECCCACDGGVQANGASTLTVRPQQLRRQQQYLRRSRRRTGSSRCSRTMALPEHRAHYRLRKQTVEPVFGIVKHDGLPAVSAAGSREGGGRMGLGNAGV